MRRAAVRRGAFLPSLAAGSPPPPRAPTPSRPPRAAEGKAPTIKYDGQYVEGVKQGIGKITLPNGDRYHGA